MGQSDPLPVKLLPDDGERGRQAVLQGSVEMTNKQAILRFDGTLEQGFKVTLVIQEPLVGIVTEAEGALPANERLRRTLENWQQSYRQCLDNSRISLERIAVESSPQVHQTACRDLGYQLRQQLQQWLDAPTFRFIDQRLREHLNIRDSGQILLRTEDVRLHRLPWHTWDFVERYPLMEWVVGTPPQRLSSPRRVDDRVRILAILGDRRNIDTEVDQQILSALPQADVTFLVEPSRQAVDDRLWEQPWDILFFAGHSHSLAQTAATARQTGRLSLNEQEVLSIEEVRYGLRRAIAQGLQLAIVNSCDGLGIAYDLEPLHLPHLIVMREPVPDEVAQAFLKYFLAAFARGESLTLALREARERLQILEHRFPWATWLPVLFQNPAVEPMTWSLVQGLVAESGLEVVGDRPPPRRRWTQALGSTLGLGLAIGLSVMTGRTLGLLQPAELAHFDHWVRLQPSEPEDDRIVVVEVTKADIQAKSEAERQGRSLSDSTLNQLLETLDALNPRLIGLDLYREQPTTLQPLINQFAHNEKLFAVCKGVDPDQGVEGIPKPPALPEERLGFSDVRSDPPDKIVRIQLLSAVTSPGSDCLMDYSLSAVLAYHALQAEGQELKFEDDGNLWQWGDVQLRRMGASAWGDATYVDYGPYAGINAQGHQILLNYRTHQSPQSPKSPIQAFQSVTVAQVLDGQLSRRDLQDKIVLIGVTAASSPDHWATPYRTVEGHPLKIPGVYLQAQMTSQILSAVLDRRPLRWCWPSWLDGVWVWLGVSGALWVLQRGQNLGRSLGVIVGGGVLLYAIAWGAFTWIGLYLPILPLGLAIAIGTMVWGSFKIQRYKPNGSISG